MNFTNIIKKHHTFNQIAQSAVIKCHIFSNIFDYQHISTTIINECSSAMLPWNK